MNDYTSIDLQEMKLGNGLTLAAWFLYTGKVLRPPTTVGLHFASTSDSWRYLSYRPLRLLLNDSTRLDLGEVEDQADVGSGYVLEQMTFSVPVSKFLQIISARKVEGELGITPFNLKPTQLEALRDLASRMSPPPTTGH